MKIYEIIAESKTSKVAAAKPRNFVAKNALGSGAGQHKDKKRAEKQGDVKHKKQAMAEVAGASKCWPGHRKVGTKPGTGKNAGKPVNKCKKIGEEAAVDESGLQYHTGVVKHGKEYMDKAAAAGRKGASQKQLGALKDKYSKAYKNKGVAETATAGATSAGNVSVGAVYANKTGKTAKNEDGTTKNALDLKSTNLLTGGSIKR